MSLLIVLVVLAMLARVQKQMTQLRKMCVSKSFSTSCNREMCSSLVFSPCSAASAPFVVLVPPGVADDCLFLEGSLRVPAAILRVDEL